MSSTLTDQRYNEVRDRVQIGFLASSNLHGLNMTDEIRSKHDEEPIFLTPRSSPYSPNGTAVCYNIPVSFPELDQQHQLPPTNVPTSPYMTGSQEDATYINPYGGSPPYSPPYDNSPLSGNCSSPGSVGSLPLDMCSPTIPCTDPNPFSHFLPQPSTCTSACMPYSCCELEVKNAPCINTHAFSQEPHNWMMPYYSNIPAVHVEPAGNELPPMDTPLMIDDRQMSNSPDLPISYYPPSPHPNNRMQHPMYSQDAKMFEGFPQQMTGPFNVVPTKKPKRQPRPCKPPIDVDDSEIKDIPSSAQLWEFTLRVLKKPKYSNMVCWENQKEGLFRFHDAQAFAALWGKHRNRPNMTYDKVARALRYYYKRNIFKQVGGRLTYRFSDRLRKLYQSEE